MLTRFVRIQLAIFTIASVVGMAVMFFQYMQVPMLLGLGRLTVTVELANTGGLYRFSNVTYRGVQVGKVTSVSPTLAGARATLSIATSPRIPANVHADVHSMSAVGEQYLDLTPTSAAPPYLRNGSVIAMRDTTIPQPVGPMLDRLSALVDSVPKDKLHKLLDESFAAFNGAGDDLRSLVDASATLARDANATGDRTRALFDDAAPLLDTQANTTGPIRTWSHSLARFSDQLVTDDPQLRTLLRDGPGFTQEVSTLPDPTQTDTADPAGQPHHYRPDRADLPSRPGTTARPVPPYVAATSSYAPTNNPTGLAPGGFAQSIADPPVCTVGFLPPSQWRSPEDTTVIDTPDNLYCKLPQDSPIGVRGARNYPCMGHPGKRPPPWRSATATSPTNHSRCASTRSAHTPWTPTCFPKASHPTTAPHSATMNSPPSKAHRYHPDQPGREERHPDPPIRPR